MKLTSVERTGRPQLIPGVRRTFEDGRFVVTGRRLALLVLLSMAVVAEAQQPASDADARAVAARKLIQATGAGRMGAQAAETVLNSMKQLYPAVPEEFWSEIRVEIRAEELADLAVPIYVKYLSLEDMQQLLTFYESPVGQKLLQVQPAILQESMSIGQQMGEGCGPPGHAAAD
jgi:hypothetical protein